MKTTKEARRAAKKLFRACFIEGKMDENNIRTVVDALAKEKPRHYLGILSVIQKMVKVEVDKRSLSVESAVPLEESEFQKIHDRVQSRFPVPLSPSRHVNPSLIGGIRIRVGSDVWDGSVAQRLASLKKNGR